MLMKPQSRMPTEDDGAEWEGGRAGGRVSAGEARRGKASQRRRGDREPGEARLAAVEPERKLTAAAAPASAAAVAGGKLGAAITAYPDRTTAPMRRGCGTDRRLRTRTHGPGSPLPRQEVVCLDHSFRCCHMAPPPWTRTGMLSH